GLTSADFSQLTLVDLPDYLMQSAPSLTSILLPPAVESIGSYAFSDTALTALSLPDTVISIGSYAFQNAKLTTLHIPASVLTIGSYAFDGVPLTSLTFEDGERSGLSIGDKAFYGASLTSLTLPDIGSANLLTIGNNTFSGTTMTTLVFQNCTLDCDSAFRNQPLVNITLPPGMTAITSGMFREVPLQSTDFLEGFNITSIGDNAFYNCSDITEFPDFPNLYSIGNYAFYNCTSLISAPNMAQVSSIGDLAFYNCDALTRLDLYAVNTSLTLGNGIIQSCDNLTTLSFHGSNTVTYNGKTPVYPYSTVSGGPFIGNSSVTTIHWPLEMTTVGKMLFANCSFVKNIDFLSEGVDNIATHAFNGSALTELTIPANIRILNSGAFSNCSRLESLTVQNSFDAWDSASSSRYYFGNVDFAANGAEPDITLPSDWTAIPNFMFYYSALTSIDFLADHPNINKIDMYAFTLCTRLTSLNIPSNITTLGARAFYDSLDSITSLTIPASVTTFEDYGGIYQQFYESTASLKNVYILNPNLDLNVDTLFTSTNSQIFNYSRYTAANPLTIHSVMDSTAFELCQATNGIYLFSAIDASGVITVSVMDGETDRTGQCTIHWTDVNGTSLGTSSQITPLEAGISYTYEIQLPEELLTKYYIPEGGGVTSTTQAQEIIVNLVPIGTTIFKGTVVNAAGEPMPLADVNVTQIVNGIESELYGWTDEDGIFTIGTTDEPALDVYTEILISYTGYYTVSHVQAEPSGLETVVLETSLKSLPASTVVLKVNAILDYQSYAMSDLSSLTFSVTNGEGMDVESTLQNNTLILTTSAGITLDSNELLYLTVDADPAAEAVAPEEPIEFYLRDKTVDVNLTSWGRISVTTEAVDPESDPGQYLWIYDSDGSLCYSDKLYALDDNGTDRFIGETDLLPEGTYTVVLIDRTFPMETVSHLDILSDFGVVSSMHYYRSELTVTDGFTAVLEDISVPDFMENGGDDLFADMFETLSINTNHARPIIGQAYYMYIDYELKE
ncbi:MAG: leucine-rich repeat protein, partial [Firmicutes bacterium]|nr:leucine-rich repeat protein [Bacillota bacterium]